MYIFLWESYDHINMYRLSNKEEVYSMFETVCSYLVGWEVHYTIPTIRLEMERCDYDYNTIINHFTKFIQTLTSLDTILFESRTGVYNLEFPTIDNIRKNHE